MTDAPPLADDPASDGSPASHVPARDDRPTLDDEATAPTPLTDPAGGVPPVVDTDEALQAAITALVGGTGPIALDAERAGGYRYSHGAYLVQLRRKGSGTHLIDPVPFEDLGSLGDAIVDEEWILHAASQDIPCLTELGMIPRRLFDTEIAGRLLGKPRVGLAALIESELGRSLAKEHSAADWSTRPLPDSWLRYAALDVELLVELRAALKQQLIDVDRWEWAKQEFEYVRTQPPRERRAEPWRRTSGIHRIRSARQLAIVRELWTRRDELARQRDIAPGRVLADAAIAAAAAARLRSKADLAELPAFQGRAAKRRLDYWWSSVERALNLRESELPDPNAAISSGPPPPRSWGERAPAAAERLARARQVVLAKSQELGLPAENLLTPDTVRRLCWSPPETVSLETVVAFLQKQGARQWQVSLTAPELVVALAPSS